MKQFILTLICALGLTMVVNAGIVSAVANGPWETASTWSTAQVPGNNDVVIIPYGKTVSINSNHNDGNNYLELRVAGVLEFIGGGAKIAVNGQSVIFVYPTGKILASQNSQEITLGNTTVMNASNSGTVISGPSVARASNNTSSLTSSTSPTGFAPYNPSALPVTFIAFTAVRHGAEVLIQWSTSAEENALQFEIETSTDGRNWSLLATQKAAGNSRIQQDYRHMARMSGTVQVRIRQVDVDGKFSYTAVRIVKAVSDDTARVSALGSKLLLVFGQEVKGAVVRIMNMNGQVLQEQKLASAFGQVLIPTTQKGLCLVAVVTENEIVATQKVVL